MPTVLELGPATVRAHPGGVARRSGDAMVAAALEGIDDAVTLLDDRPVSVAALWRALIASILDKRRDPVVILHPSWWPRPQIDRVVTATGATGRSVIAVSRAELIRREHPTAGPVIEIAPELVAVFGGSGVRVFGRGVGGDIESVADAAAEMTESVDVLLDAGTAVPGSAQCAREIREALSRRGLTARDACVADLATAAATRRRQRPIGVGLAAAAVLAALAGAVATRQAHHGAPDPATASPAAASMVEGRVAVLIPANWTVERITGGPGSRRVQVSSPSDPQIALHITQSYAPETTLAQAAAVLSRAIADQPAGVFVDFRPTDEVSGRPTATYREIRPGQVIRWSVLLAGSTQISIGCQSAPGREDAITGPCGRAVASAREVGTAARR